MLAAVVAPHTQVLSFECLWFCFWFCSGPELQSKFDVKALPRSAKVETQAVNEIDLLKDLALSMFSNRYTEALFSSKESVVHAGMYLRTLASFPKLAFQSVESLGTLKGPNSV